MRNRLLTILIAPLLVLGCGEEPTIQTYEVTQPVGFDWPESELREVSVEVDGLDWVWEVPAGWIDAPEVPDQLIADYRFKGATELLPGRVTVSKLDGDGGGVNANVLRWLGQIYLPDMARMLGPKDSITPAFNLDYGAVTFVDLHGQYQGEFMPTRIYGALIQLPAEGGGVYQTWFIKLACDEQTFDSKDVRTGLVQMALTFRPKGTPRPMLPGVDKADKADETDTADDIEEPAGS